jgi:STE24 endopeptidase
MFFSTMFGYSCRFISILIFRFAVQIIMITIYPTVIQPLFNTFTPLKEGELKNKINELAARVHFPLTKVFVVDGSRRSSHSNAYFFGFFKNKRIVLFDTLLEHSNTEEILGVLGHELGHWKFNHVFRMLVISQIHLFTIFYSFSFFINDQTMYSDFGFSTQPILIGLILFNYLYVNYLLV